MKFTIIIPYYNQQEYVGQAVESALAQTYKAQEIIVVNDGSKEPLPPLSPDIRVINQTNRGLASARNTGIMNSLNDTDYIFPLDADDIMMEKCLEVVNHVAEETKADIVAPSFKEFGVRNTLITLMPNPQLDDFKNANRLGYFSAIKKSALLEVGGYSSRMIWGYEDYHLWINLLIRGKNIVTIPETLMLYRTKSHSMLNDALSHHNELMTQIYKDFPEFR